MKYFAIAIRPSWGEDPTEFEDVYNIAQSNSYCEILEKAKLEIIKRGGKYTGMIMNTERWGRVMVDSHGNVVEHFYKNPGEDELWKGVRTLTGLIAAIEEATMSHRTIRRKK